MLGKSKRGKTHLTNKFRSYILPTVHSPTVTRKLKTLHRPNSLRRYLNFDTAVAESPTIYPRTFPHCSVSRVEGDRAYLRSNGRYSRNKREINCLPKSDARVRVLRRNVTRLQGVL